MTVTTLFMLSLFCTIAKSATTSSKKSPSVPPAAQINVSKVTPAVQTNAPIGAPSTSNLEFNCTNGNITNIAGKDIEEKAIVVDFRNRTMCHISDKNCTWQNLYKKLHVIYYKNETNAKVVAGHPDYYELECKSGYVVRATAAPFLIGSTIQSYIYKEFKPSDKPGITIELHKGNTKLKLADRVYIGDLLSLKIHGPDKSTIIPINCTATDTSYTYLLWDKSTCKSKDEAIMQNNWTIGTGSTSVNMYAFRFVDSNSVTIECSVYICPLSDANCTSSENNCSGKNGNTRRRRRSSNMESNYFDEYKEETSSVSFTVVDRFDGTNGSEGVFGNILLYLTSVLIIIWFLGKE